MLLVFFFDAFAAAFLQHTLHAAYFADAADIFIDAA